MYMYLYIYAIVMLKCEKNASHRLIFSEFVWENPIFKLAGEECLQAMQGRELQNGTPKNWGFCQSGGGTPRGLDPHKKCHCHLFFFWLAKKQNHDPPGNFHLNQQILQSQGGWMIFWFIVFVVGKIRGKHGFYYTFKCIGCTKIRVSHLTFFTSLGAFTFITLRCEHQRVHNNKWHADHSKTKICFFVVKRRWKLIVRPIVLNVSMFELNHSLQNLLLCSDSTYFLHKILGFQYLVPEQSSQINDC